jgi:hypothetical protein
MLARAGHKARPWEPKRLWLFAVAGRLAVQPAARPAPGRTSGSTRLLIDAITRPWVLAVPG